MTPFEKFESELAKTRQHFARERDRLLADLAESEKKQVNLLSDVLKAETKDCKHKEYVKSDIINWQSLDTIPVLKCKNCGKIK
jgi:hypothetical protein